MATTNKIFVQIDDEKIELTGIDKEAFVADQKMRADAQILLEAEYQAKRDARESALKKLADIAGLTKAELDSIL